MRAPPVPENEAERLAELYDFGILDTPAEKIFDEIAELAATICGTRIGAVTLVDRDRQWFKAEFGLKLGQTSRDESVCGHAILEHEIFEVPDTLRDERFVANPVLNGPPAIRFYGGSQLSTGRGHAIGMLCVMDSEPRELTSLQRTSLKQLADVLMAVLEAGRSARLLSWFGTLLDTISEEIFILDPRTLLYLHVNRSACEHLGYRQDELRRMTPMDVTGDPNRARFEGYVARLEAGEPAVVFEGERGRSDGTRYPVESNWQLLTTRGRPVIISIVQDVTERRKIERMKDEFVSVVNHELRTPLTSIHGAIRLLEQGAAGPLPAQAMHLIELAAHNTQRLRGIVDDILDLEQIASGRMRFDLEAVGARQTLERVAGALEPAAQHADLTLAVEGDPGLILVADARRLQQVLANLLSNALKFAPPQSTVRLTAVSSGQAVRLSVRDAGPGVPAEFADRIFQRFAQAHMDSSRSKGGSGLGLSIAKQMTEQMNGAIGFDSRPGSTTFWVELPQGSTS